jgi:hypothetical protein
MKKAPLEKLDLIKAEYRISRLSKLAKETAILRISRSNFNAKTENR